TVCYEIFRKISIAAKKMAVPDVRLKVHPAVADLMLNEESGTVDNIEKKIGKRLTIVPAHDLHVEKYEIVWG
ncbi:MAG: ribonuclease, partial [Desulfobulbaceae bacterium]|nr:ribonuclease [Desulfobulbaceae bacterium]